MAVQKSRKTPSRRNMRRSHDALKNAALSVDPVSGETHRRHHVTADGYYRGRKVVGANKATGTEVDVHARKEKKKTALRTAIAINCPEIFSLRKNFDGVVKSLHEIRMQSERQRNERVYINFRPIRKLSPAAALAFAAELDRWNHLPGKKGRLKPVDVTEWDPQVCRLLGEMGFFDLLRVKTTLTPDTNATTRYVKFHTGCQADGEAIDLLRRETLDPVVGEVPGKRALYAAVTEAMTNVVHHAYKTSQAGSPLRPHPNWWLSASYDSNKREVVILIYDQGVGIPETLSRKFGEFIKSFGRDNHAEMIQVAHNLSRSATKAQHRGHGLQRDVRAYLENLDYRGEYRVVSLKGEYIWERDAAGEARHRLKNHAFSLYGTLIEWKIYL